MAETVQQAMQRILGKQRPLFRGNALLTTQHLNYFKPLKVPKEILDSNILLDEIITVNPLTSVVEVCGLLHVSFNAFKKDYTLPYRYWSLNNKAKEILDGLGIKDNGILSVNVTDEHYTSIVTGTNPIGFINKTVGLNNIKEFIDIEFGTPTFNPSLIDIGFVGGNIEDASSSPESFLNYKVPLLTSDNIVITINESNGALENISYNVNKENIIRNEDNYFSQLCSNQTTSAGRFVSYKYRFIPNEIDIVTFYEKLVKGEYWVKPNNNPSINSIIAFQNEGMEIKSVKEENIKITVPEGKSIEILSLQRGFYSTKIEGENRYVGAKEIDYGFGHVFSVKYKPNMGDLGSLDENIIPALDNINYESVSAHPNSGIGIPFIKDNAGNYNYWLDEYKDVFSSLISEGNLELDNKNKFKISLNAKVNVDNAYTSLDPNIINHYNNDATTYQYITKRVFLTTTDTSSKIFNNVVIPKLTSGDGYHTSNADFFNRILPNIIAPCVPYDTIRYELLNLTKLLSYPNPSRGFPFWGAGSLLVYELNHYLKEYEGSLGGEHDTTWGTHARTIANIYIPKSNNDKITLSTKGIVGENRDINYGNQTKFTYLAKLINHFSWLGLLPHQNHPNNDRASINLGIPRMYGSILSETRLERDHLAHTCILNGAEDNDMVLPSYLMGRWLLLSAITGLGSYTLDLNRFIPRVNGELQYSGASKSELNYENLAINMSRLLGPYAGTTFTNATTNFERNKSNIFRRTNDENDPFITKYHDEVVYGEKIYKEPEGNALRDDRIHDEILHRYNKVRGVALREDVGFPYIDKITPLKPLYHDLVTNGENINQALRFYFLYPLATKMEIDYEGNTYRFYNQFNLVGNGGNELKDYVHDLIDVDEVDNREPKYRGWFGFTNVANRYIAKMLQSRGTKQFVGYGTHRFITEILNPIMGVHLTLPSNIEYDETYFRYINGSNVRGFTENRDIYWLNRIETAYVDRLVIDGFNQIETFDLFNGSLNKLSNLINNPENDSSTLITDTLNFKRTFLDCIGKFNTLPEELMEIKELSTLFCEFACVRFKNFETNFFDMNIIRTSSEGFRFDNFTFAESTYSDDLTHERRNLDDKTFQFRKFSTKFFHDYMTGLINDKPIRVKLTIDRLLLDPEYITEHAGEGMHEYTLFKHSTLSNERFVDIYFEMNGVSPMRPSMH